ncbi:hypothetical protein F442_01947 [Phytophthora nicotianae P10297]|uniref:Uncharacterized protein n=1 Tax=Phytophthora nicotianae P10297 TaxID=1317064 RepID=W3A1S2_PHYNI|nr:hypothetical protein F442_01947 [Phytophthora nicotianae P10297]
MAIHSAVIAGDWQIAKLLLECDNMVDLNTPTCHTKETLAHLAVKFGHMEVFVGLHRNAVDFRILNAKGQFVWEMTADRTFSEKNRDVATEMEFTSRLGRGRRDSPGVFQQQLTRLAEQSRKLVIFQRDHERQNVLEEFTTNSPVAIKREKKSTKSKKSNPDKRGDTSSNSSGTVDSPSTHTDPILAPVREFCAATIDFVKFVVRTARTSLSVGREAQASEVLAVLEKRLLKTPFSEREPPIFREMVQSYSKERFAMELGKTTSPDTFRRLEWYLSTPVQDPKLLMTLDTFVGRPFYFKLVISSGTSNQNVNCFGACIKRLSKLSRSPAHPVCRLKSSRFRLAEALGMLRQLETGEYDVVPLGSICIQ